MLAHRAHIILPCRHTETPRVWLVFLQMPMMLLLQFINISHLAAILILSHLWQLKDSWFSTQISFSLFMPISFEIVLTCVYIQNINTHDLLLSWLPQIFYICKLYLYLHFYDVLCFPSFRSTFLCKCLWCFYTHKHFILKLNTYVYICKTVMCMTCSVYSPKYFTFVSHICFFKSVIY